VATPSRAKRGAAVRGASTEDALASLFDDPGFGRRALDLCRGMNWRQQRQVLFVLTAFRWSLGLGHHGFDRRHALKGA
jgi:hypothetical protein